MSHYGNRFFRAVVTLLEWILKKVVGPDRWRPAGAIRVLPPSALVYDAADEARAEGVFQKLSMLGFSPTKVPVQGAGATIDTIRRSIAAGTPDCWATVVLEPADEASARQLGPAFREFAHLHPDVVAVVVGPLPSRSEVLERYRHVITDEGGACTGHDLAAGIAHASAARVLHCARLLNTGVAALTAVVAIAVVAWGLVGWLAAR